ncbi:unnamed protein product [Macrosiphum euphorbiae]|uniref:Uncharacterized protein n=1 Tax=Macrosiphum euphorbiae TaxID=13131 RepID=A0AAV0VGS2_9HEMI|nr:unnamed protein product [Macrosiphum euphorbiae]
MCIGRINTFSDKRISDKIKSSHLRSLQLETLDSVMDSTITSDKLDTVLKSIDDSNNMKRTQNKLIPPVNSIHMMKRKEIMTRSLFVLSRVLYAESNF